MSEPFYTLTVVVVTQIYTCDKISKDFIFLIFLCVFTVFRVFTAAWGFSIVALCRLLTVEASLVAEHGLWGTWTSVAVASRL